MSPFFIKKFRGVYQCKACDVEKVSGNKLCTKHLVYAREKWRTWAADRTAIGRCVQCDRKGRKATRWHYSRTMEDREQRCTIHAEVNRLRCKRWGRANPERSHLDWEKDKKVRDSGFCPTCREHRKLPVGRTRCIPCYTLQKFGHGPKWKRAVREASVSA